MYGATVPITVVRDPDVTISGSTTSDGHMDALFLKNAATGNYLKVYAAAVSPDAASYILTEPE